MSLNISWLPEKLQSEYQFCVERLGDLKELFDAGNPPCLVVEKEISQILWKFLIVVFKHFHNFSFSFSIDITLLFSKRITFSSLTVLFVKSSITVFKKRFQSVIFFKLILLKDSIFDLLKEVKPCSYVAFYMLHGIQGNYVICKTTCLTQLRYKVIYL